MIIDGQPAGHPTYNQFRNDVATIFPGLANSNGAVGFFYLDTTQLSNGMHTISWVVYDNAGRGDGIGSRYFTVQNSSGVATPDSQPLASALRVMALLGNEHGAATVSPREEIGKI